MLNTIIARHFNTQAPRFGCRLLDLGAGHPDSVARPFVIAGWDAVLVEAAAEPFTRLMQSCLGLNRTRLVNAFVVGATSAFGISRLVTFKQSMPLLPAGAGSVPFPTMVPALRVGDLTEMFPGPYDLINIHVGHETYGIFCDLVEQSRASCLVVHRVAEQHDEQVCALAGMHGYTEVAKGGDLPDAATHVFTR